MKLALASTAITATAAALDASVWTFDNAFKGPSISPENARIVLAHRLGLSRYHEIGHADDQTIKLLNDVQGPLFTAEQPSRKLMLLVEGLQDDSFATAPSFTISNPPTSAMNSQLVNDLLLQDMHSRDASSCGKQQTTGLTDGGISANMPAGLCTIGVHKESSELSAMDLMQILSGSPDTMSSHIYGTPQPPAITTDYTAIYHIKTLEDAASKHGLNSAQYRDLSSIMSKTISTAQKVSHFDQFIVVGTPYQPRLSKRDDYGSYEVPVQTRKEKPLRDFTVASTAPHAQATSVSNRTIPKTTLPVCWSSESTCKLNTVDCSGHGSCHKKYTEKVSNDETGAECWACACTPTYIDQSEGRKTIYWGGPACQKKDISVPFFLFAGFGIAAIAALSYGVGMLYSIGEEDLPSVLGAGVAPTTRK